MINWLWCSASAAIIHECVFKIRSGNNKWHSISKISEVNWTIQ
jgi:hypothetical protein